MEAPCQVEYKGCTIELRSRFMGDGKHVPAAVVHVHKGATSTLNAFCWPESRADTADEADRFALVRAMRWVDGNG